MSIFLLVMFIMLLVVGGMAVDYQRHEALRADLQDALDRGALAAANLNQAYVTGGAQTTSDQARQVVVEYMASRNFRREDLNVNANVRTVGGGREVSANARVEMGTIFLSLIGIDTLRVNARSVATHAASNVEIVLALDVTQSMTQNASSGGTKISQLRSAAKEFVDTVLAGDARDQTMVSVVPFSQNVALPASIANRISILRHHNYANCIDFSQFDFRSRAMPFNPLVPYLQMQHFRESIGSGTHGCPAATNAITPFTNDAQTLKTAIDAMTPETWTAAYMGMKWATTILDPGSSVIVDDQIAAGRLPASFAGAPHAWNDVSTRKIIVLMSDGANTELHRIVPSIYASRALTWWNTNLPRSGDVEKVIDNSRRGDGDPLLHDICAAARTGQNVVIYTIGFEVSDSSSAQAALRDCATGPSTYYLVEGVEISTAFRNIADEITNLKLTH